MSRDFSRKGALTCFALMLFLFVLLPFRSLLPYFVFEVVPLVFWAAGFGFVAFLIWHE